MNPSSIPAPFQPVETGHDAPLDTPILTTEAQVKRAHFVVHKGLTHIVRNLSDFERKVAMALASIAAITDYPHVKNLFPSNPDTRLTGKYFQRKRKAVFKWMRNERPEAYAALMSHYRSKSGEGSGSSQPQPTTPTGPSSESKQGPSPA